MQDSFVIKADFGTCVALDEISNEETQSSMWDYLPYQNARLGLLKQILYTLSCICKHLQHYETSSLVFYSSVETAAYLNIRRMRKSISLPV